MKNTVDIFSNLETEIAKMTDSRTRRISEARLGCPIRQGDIYIHPVASNHPRGGILESHQLAVGTSKGSRHMADENFTVYRGTTLPDYVAPGTFLGPLIVTDRISTITHPEHPWVELPAGTYQITHQTDLRTRQRAKD